jgi:hypothetical protein
LFAGKEWLFSPEPLLLDAKQVAWLEKLGHRLAVFQKACNQLYRLSAAGRQPKWVADYMDQGKPDWLVAHGRTPTLREELPAVIRPDLLLTEEGFAVSELDSVPGGIGLTAWLSEQYDGFGYDLIGGRVGMMDGFRGILGTGADILVSDEAATYRPEMEWAASRLGEGFRVHAAESYDPAIAGERTVYRFFELFDLANIPPARALMERAERGGGRMTAPAKAYMEEKMWMALFWSRTLRAFWRRELSDAFFSELQNLIPRSWVVDPAPIPHHAVIPGLEINAWEELAEFSQKERELVLKISGYSELAWGSRGVTIGNDVSQSEWRTAVFQAIKSFNTNPYIVQEFKKARVIEHPYEDRQTGQVLTMRGRARICPYYFISENRAKLAGALATIVPADKKIIHGMKDGILVPVALRQTAA